MVGFLGVGGRFCARVGADVVRLFGAAGLILAVGSAAFAAPRYSINAIGPLPPGVNTLSPSDISDDGVIVGAAIGSGPTRGFSIAGGVTTLLNPLPGGLAGASGVNSAGEVIGSSDLEGIPKAVIWTGVGTAAAELETSGGPGANVYATEINDSASVVGYFTTSGSGNVNSWTPVRWDRDDRGRFRETELDGPVPPAPGVFSAAFGINDAGYVVGTGSSQQAGVPQAALRWSPSGAVEELETVPGIVFPRFEADAINESNVAAGWGVNNTGHYTPIRWAADRTATDLGQPAGFTSTQAFDINNDGAILATASNGPFDTQQRPMAYLDGVWMDLNHRLVNGAGWDLNSVTAINDSGQIVGGGLLNGVATGFVLTPTTTAPGDFDFDGLVSGSDFLVWQREVGSANSSPADANDDGVVNAADLAVWSTAFGGAGAAVQGVPEPAAGVLALVCARLLGYRRQY